MQEPVIRCTWSTTLLLSHCDGTTCQNYTNELDVVDVKDLVFTKTHSKIFNAEAGRFIRIDDKLYLCENEFGFKIFDNTDAHTVGNKIISQDKIIQCL